jgi:hypothetical protein
MSGFNLYKVDTAVHSPLILASEVVVQLN